MNVKFSIKSKKNPSQIPSASSSSKVEYIEFVENSSIVSKDKIGGENAEKLVINQSEEFLKSKFKKIVEIKIADRQTSINEQNKQVKIDVNDGDALENQAIQELHDQAKGIEQDQSKSLTLPLNPNELVLAGAAEPTEEEFESVKIEDFGKALLRGMGWKDPVEEKKPFENEVFAVRPKGMGLGADKLIKRPAPSKSSDSSELVIKRNAKIRILAGRHKDFYGILESFENANRVTIKLAINSTKVSINESIICAVSESEYKSKAKVLNNARYEEHKTAAPSHSSSRHERKNRSRSRESHRSHSNITSSSKRRSRSRSRERRRQDRR